MVCMYVYLYVGSVLLEVDGEFLKRAVGQFFWDFIWNLSLNWIDLGEPWRGTKFCDFDIATSLL